MNKSNMIKKRRFGVWSRVGLMALLAITVTGAVFGFWRPWQEGRSNRVIEVAGQGIVTAVPDEYVFRAEYEFKNTDEQTAHDMADEKHRKLSAQLQELGVSGQNIKANMHKTVHPLRDGISDETKYTLILAATANDQNRAKVDEYLVASTPVSPISQYLQFSKQKREAIEFQAIASATKDARARAERSAEGLGLRVGGVKKISDGFAFGHPISWDAFEESTIYHAVLHPGDNDVTYEIMVTFFLQ